MNKSLLFVDAIGSAEITGGPYDGVCFYIGGDAFRIWPKNEVYARPERYRLPIWVRSNPQQVSATADSVACISALIMYGVPQGKLVALDSETSVDSSWVNIFVGNLNTVGYPVIDYGSQSVVFKNMVPGNYYWGADWTNVLHLHIGDGMTQYVSFNNEDISEANPSLPFWDTRPAPIVNPKPKPSTIMKGNPMIIIKVTAPKDHSWEGTRTFLYAPGSVPVHIVSGVDQNAFSAVLSETEITWDQFTTLGGS